MKCENKKSGYKWAVALGMLGAVGAAGTLAAQEPAANPFVNKDAAKTAEAAPAAGTAPAADAKKEAPAAPAPEKRSKKNSMSAEEYVAQILEMDDNQNGVIESGEYKDDPKTFKRADANKDGNLDKSEIDDAAKKLAERDRPGAAGRGSYAAKVFGKLDANNDGAISRDEAQGPLASRFENFDKNGDGLLKGDELKPPDGEVQEKIVEQLKNRLPDGDALMQRLDTNSDGKIAREEAKGPIAERFDEIDGDKDGAVNPDELRASFRKRAEEMVGERVDALTGRGPAGGAGGPGKPGAERPGPRVPHVLREFDANKDGALTKDEIPSRDKLFAKLDKDNDGRITPEELVGPGPGGPRPEARAEGGPERPKRPEAGPDGAAPKRPKKAKKPAQPAKP